MISQFKKEVAVALDLVKKATDGFREIHQINAAQAMPAEVSAAISTLSDQARDLRAKLGYEVAMYECGAETSVTEALAAVDQSTRDLTEKNAPAARLKLMKFVKRYPVPNRENHKPLWRYLGYVLRSCEQARKDAQGHLDRAKSLEAAGKKDEAIREYQEIFRIYPNPITADKLQTLQTPPE